MNHIQTESHSHEFTVEGHIVDVQHGKIFPGTVTVSHGRITSIRENPVTCEHFILPGLIDAHVHVESSMLAPTQFARMAVLHGTVGTVSDPHEIANVLGIPGVEFMLEDAARTPFKFMFGAPSCVPATTFETAGAVLGPDEIEYLLKRSDIGHLAEVMNFPGVLAQDEVLLKKMALAKKFNKPIDGHAPGLRGEAAQQYIEAGIETDHECFTIEEAKEKLELGMKILIREGSAAKNFEALIPLLADYPDQIMFCSDDKHPDSLLEGHINDLLRRSVEKGIAPLDAIRAATKNPIEHYRMDVGLLQVGDPADFIIIEDLSAFRVISTYIDGKLVANAGTTLLPEHSITPVNNFYQYEVTPQQIQVKANDTARIRVIEALPGELITKESVAQPRVEDGFVVSDPSQDVLKLVNVNRYHEAPPAIGFVRNIGIKSGAIAGSVGHDSHNIIAVGTSDEEICAVINLLMEHTGGLALSNGAEQKILPLEIAGLMSTKDGFTVAELYTELDQRAKALGSTLPAPYMTLSFLPLLVIPDLKLSDKGLFSILDLEFKELFVQQD